MSIRIDARGEACPRPVIMTKNRLDEIGEGLVTTLVDNDVAKENIIKLANSLGYRYEVEEKSECEYHVHIVKGKNVDRNELAGSKKDKVEETTIAFASSRMGSGSEELGKILMKSFLYTVMEAKPYPSTLIFYNGGVYLTCEGSEVLEDLRVLESKGVKVISCGTCLDFFKIKNKLQVGEISNMYTIYEKLKEKVNLITIG